MAPRSFLAKVYAFRFLDGFVLIYPLYTVMFAARGLSPSQVAATLMAWSVAGFLLQIPTGVLADRWSRRWLLCLGQLLRAAGFVIWILAPGFPGFLIGMVLWGVKSALTNGTFEALVYDELHAAGEAHDYPRVIGRAWGALSAAVLLTSLATALLVRFGHVAILEASIGMGLVAAASALALPRAQKALKVARPHYFAHLARGVSTVVRDPLLLGLVAFAALSQAFGGGMESLWQILGREAGMATPLIPLFGAAIGASQIAGAFLAHRFARGGGRGRFYGFFGLAGGLLAIGAAILQPWSALLVVPAAGLFKAIDVNFDSRLQRAIGPENRATIGSVKSFAGAALMTGVLGGFGWLAQAQDYRAAFLGAGLAMAAVAAAYGLAGLRRREA
ncbi:MAG: MFS transporter [Phenylobacterium sp.]